jgi:hypothetical protein
MMTVSFQPASWGRGGVGAPFRYRGFPLALTAATRTYVKGVDY